MHIWYSGIPQIDSLYSRLQILRRYVTNVIGLAASGLGPPRLIRPDKAITDIFLEFL